MEYRICNKCCDYTDSFIDSVGDCIKCTGYEPKKRQAKILKREQNEKKQSDYADKRTRAKEVREREREKERKKRQTDFI